MRTFLSILILLTACQSARPLPALSALDDERVALWRSVRDGCYTVHVGDFIGSGWAWDERHIITCAHVVDGKPESPILETFDGELIVCDVAWSDSARDIAIIRLPSGFYANELKRATSRPRVGERAWTMGAPLGVQRAWTEGVVSRPYGLGFIVDSEVTAGSSGGPVFNSSGEVIGMVWGVRMAEASGGHWDFAYGFCLGIGEITESLRGSGVPGF